MVRSQMARLLGEGPRVLRHDVSAQPPMRGAGPVLADADDVPAVTPARIHEQRRYRREDPDVGIRELRGKRVHPRWGHSASNLHRRVATEIPDGAFVWFSGD